MKRIFALTLALAMVLSLAACGGKSTDQPSSNNTPPVTQGEQNQPDSPPADNTQPSESEPADTTTDEPQNNAGALPEAGFYLYDGVHYLSAVSGGDSYITSTEISGKKIANNTHEMFVELTESVGDGYPGSMSITLGQNAGPFDYQISFVDEDVAEYNGIEKAVAPGEVGEFGATGAWVAVHNSTDTEKTISECPILHLTIDYVPIYKENNGTITLDGKTIATLDDLIDILGTPTAAFSEYPECTYFIWQSDDFIYTAGFSCEIEEVFDEVRQIPYFNVNWDTAKLHLFSYYALNSGIDEYNIPHYEPWNTTFPVQTLTDLGLL